MTPTLLPYRGAPTGDIAATEAAIDALAVMRRWGVLLEILLFVYGGAGLLAGAWVMLVVFMNFGQPGFALPLNLFIAIVGLVFGSLSLASAIYLFRFTRAARATIIGRETEDLERTMIALARYWRVVTIAIMAVMCLPIAFVILGLAVGAFP